MSREAAPFEVQVEPERLPARTIAEILVAGIFIICVCAVVVKAWLPRRTPIETTIHGAPERIGNIEQTLFLGVHSTARREAEKEARLDRYGWVDKDHKVVAIPIERAMQLIVEGRR